MKNLLRNKNLSILLLMSFVFVYIVPSSISVKANNLNLLPSGFTNSVVGVGNEGQVTFDYDSNTLIVEGTGNVIGKDPGSNDNYQFVNYEVNGDATIIARLVDFNMTNAKYGQAGVIIRGDNISDNSDYFAVYVEPNKDEYRYAFRDTTSNKTGAKKLNNLSASNKEIFIKLTKNGTSFKYYLALDGEFNNIIDQGGQTIQTEDTVWNLGFVVSNGGSKNPAIAKFDNITILDKDGVIYPEKNEIPEIPQEPETPEVPEVPEVTEAFLPKGFTNTNIGNDEEVAYVNFDKINKQFTINGSGKYIGKDMNSTDSYQFVSYEVEGDATVIARLVDFDMSKAKYGQAGLFVRNDNSSDNADYFGVYVEPSKNQYRYAYRDKANGKSGAAAINGIDASNKNMYIKIVKEGSRFKYYISEDISFPSDKTYTNAQTVNNTSSNWYVGFVVSNGGSAEAATAKFDNVRIETASKIYYDSSLEERPVSAVENILAEAGNSEVTLLWDSVEDDTSYIVMRALSKDGEYEEIAIVTENTYIDTTVTNFIPYYYKVIAVNEEGYSHDSQVVKAIPNNSNSENIQFEEDAAIFTMTSEPEDTVFTSVITLAGYTDKDGTITIEQDGKVVAEAEEKSSGEEFNHKLSLNLGRNEIKIIQATEDGKKSIKNYNIIYLNSSYYHITVDGNYNGKSNVDIEGKPIYKTITEAISTISTKNKERITIFIKNGTYKEKLTIQSPYVTIIGEDRDNTILTYDDANGTINPSTGTNYGTSKSASVTIKSKAVGFTAENLTIENAFEEKGNEGEQAVALNNQADESMFINCKFIANQDTLLADASSKSPARQYYYKCYIEGDVDFIFGRAQAVFDDCDIASFNRNSAPNNGYITAADTWDKDAYGYLIINSRLIGLDDIADESVSLGRPWRPSSATEKITPSVVYVNCYMGSHISTKGWDDMGENSLAADSRLYEFGSYGPGARSSDTRNVLSLEEASNYTMEKIFASNAASNNFASNWNPMSLDNINNVNAIFEDVIKSTSIEVEDADITLLQGETIVINTTVMPENASNKEVVFESSNDNIASINEDGVLIAVNPGNAVITVRNGNVKNTINVTVNYKAIVINSAPTITVEDIAIEEGTEFNAKDFASAEDKEDGDLTEKIEVISNNVDVNIAGEYEVTYKVTDSNGASAVKTIKVTINKKIELPVEPPVDETPDNGEMENPDSGEGETPEIPDNTPGDGEEEIPEIPDNAPGDGEEENPELPDNTPEDDNNSEVEIPDDSENTGNNGDENHTSGDSTNNNDKMDVPDNTIIKEENKEESENDAVKIPATGGTSSIIVLSIAALLVISGIIISRKKKKINL